jgi:hypothetical protein
MQPLELLTVGTDAEMFLRNKDTNEIISAEGYIRGSKHNPRRFDKENKWFTTQLDNVLAEFTIPPAKTAAEFLKSVARAIDYVNQILPDNIEPVIQASANLDEKYLQTEQAMMFGCDPDFNAYTGFINEKPFCEDHTLRSAGAHLHLGYKGVETKFKNRNSIFDYAVDPQRANIVKVLDLFISIPLVLMEPDSERKRLYGKAGAFRPKPYGLEYRTPSSWYLSSDALTKWAFNSTKKAFDYFASKGKLNDGLAAHVQAVINTNDKPAAKDLVTDFKLQLV